GCWKIRGKRFSEFLLIHGGVGFRPMWRWSFACRALRRFELKRKSQEARVDPREMKLFIGNLSYETTEEELRAALAAHEPVIELHRPVDRETGKPRGFAFATFASQEAGEEAMKALDGTKLNGRAM